MLQLRSSPVVFAGCQRTESPFRLQHGALAVVDLVRPLFGPPLNSFEFCDGSLRKAADVKLMPVEVARQAQRQRGLGVDEHPATLLLAGDVVDCDWKLIHAVECKTWRDLFLLHALNFFGVLWTVLEPRT